ncbi:Gamma-glutamyl hydrolase 1 isoform 2 [Theobroma cacao]|uniref:folate gamma-glutamyl hydrolase n=1 Tax=Theobroma cacao TaxID=3641 RepID=A0A061F9N9_THECC|nr:Gamma-glutamyl hydrolase 1 isoform 2 [Theobroma cacao]
MPSLFLSNPSSPSSSSDTPNDAVPSPSASSSSSSDMWNYLIVPILFYLSKDLSLAKAETSTPLLLPSQRRDNSSAETLSSASSCTTLDPKLYYRPVIGILSHPGDGASGRLNNDTNASYIAASYVKFVEAAGARVIPLIYNEPEEILFEKLELVNGVLFTGGWAKAGLYYEIAQKIFKDRNILESFSAADQASSLQFVKNINIEGTVFQRFPPDLLKKLGADCLVMQNHHYGISPERLRNNPNLSSFFKILTTSTDDNNEVYVSTVQAHGYPVTAFQWHPEKNAFEWGSTMIPHSEDAIQVTQHVANFLISEARKSLNRPPPRKVLDNLIYNYSPTYCGKAGKGFDEVYIFTQLQPRI